MALLEHPNIVRVYDVGSIGDVSYIVMEIVEGGSLVDWLERHGAMPPGLALRAMDQLCHGITAAHARGVIHRDIKPHNILVTLDGTCRVTDFGIARVGDGDVSLTKTGAVMGTWGYMAPEQRSDAKNVDVRADVYAIAATLYTMVTNRIPMDLFAADRDKSVMSGVPEALYPVLVKATDYHRENRYPDVESLRQALAEVAARLAPDPPSTPPLVLRRPDRRDPPTPETIARAIPLVPEGPGPQMPTLLPNTMGYTSGQGTHGDGTDPDGVARHGAPITRFEPGPGGPDHRADVTVDFSEHVASAPARRRSPLAYAAPVLVAVVGLLLLVGAVAVLAPAMLRRTAPAGPLEPLEPSTVAGVDSVPKVPENAASDQVIAGNVAAGVPEVGTTEAGVPVDPRPPTGVRKPPAGTRPPVSAEGTPDGSQTVGTSPPDLKEGPNPSEGSGTADPPLETPKEAAPTVTVVAVKPQCVDVTAPGAATLGGSLQIQATLCQEDPGKTVTLWYRPSGGDGWQAVGMPLRLGARRAIVKVDDRFAAGVQYYVETDGATAGSRANPRVVNVQ
jgi:hypothetical protein